MKKYNIPFDFYQIEAEKLLETYELPMSTYLSPKQFTFMRQK